MNDGICLRLFVWPREKPRLNKKLAPFNVGFCEIAGYVTVGCKFLFVFFFVCEPPVNPYVSILFFIGDVLYESLTEETIQKNIVTELGNGINEKMEQDLIKLLTES